MKKLLSLIVIAYLLCSIQVWAMKPLFPPPKDQNWINTQSNFDSIIARRVSLTNGVSSQTFDFPCETTSAILATINTADAAYIKSAVPIGNQVTVTLSGAASSTLEIALFTIL